MSKDKKTAIYKQLFPLTNFNKVRFFCFISARLLYETCLHVLNMINCLQNNTKTFFLISLVDSYIYIYFNNLRIGTDRLSIVI